MLPSAGGPDRSVKRGGACGELLWCCSPQSSEPCLAVLIPSVAHAEGEQLTLVVQDQAERTPIPGVKFTVTGEGFEEEAETGDDGRAVVPLPGDGTFTAEIDTGSLPEGVGLTDPEATSREKVVLVGQSTTLLFPVGEGLSSGGAIWERGQQLFADGIVFGLIIALAAVGLSLIFGTTGLTNFAHGELVTFGAVIALFFNIVFTAGPFPVTLLLAAPLAVLAGGLFGSAQDKFFWRPLRRRGTGLIALLVVSIGLSIFLRYLFLFLTGGQRRAYAQFQGQSGIEIGAIDITPRAMVSAAIALTACVLVGLWLLRTRMGKATRAVSDNPALASASGIDVDRVINVVWFLGAGLAALAGVILALIEQYSFDMGFKILLLIFAAVVVGGLGTAFGAMVGGLLVGLTIQLSTLIIPSELKNVGALGIMIVVLLIRPQGLLGRRERVG